LNPDEYVSPWEYKRLDEIHHQRMNALKDYYYNDDNFDDEANEKRYSEREMEMNYEVAKERLRAGFERQFEKEMTQLTDELNQKEDEIWKLKKEILDMKEDIKLIDKMKELLKQYALYSEIGYDEQSLTLKL
jgi:hypothetical protein